MTDLLDPKAALQEDRLLMAAAQRAETAPT
jgi:hypothetical protein